LKDDLARNYKDELSRLVDDFKGKFNEGTKHSESFLTMSEIERMWGELRHHTCEIYSDMIMDAMSAIDEGDLIHKKKRSINEKG
jgi:hypothetical protein